MKTETKQHIHWTKYPIEEIVYGTHRFGPGSYRVVNGVEKDWWLDQELTTPQQKKTYNSWLKNNGYEEVKKEK